MRAFSDEALLAKLKDFTASMEAEVKAKDEKLQETGYKGYAK